MKTAILVFIILLGGIMAAAVVGRLVRGEAQEQPVEPGPVLVYCHANGGVVVDGKCVARQRRS